MDSTQLWVIVLGILSVLLAGIVFYSLRRLLMLRDAVLKSTDLITVLEKQQEFTKHLLEGDLIPKIDNTSQSQGQTIEKLLGDIRTINSQLNKVHDQVQDHENRIQNVTKRLKQVEVKAEALNSRERIVDPAADQQQASAGGSSGKGKGIGGGGGAYSNAAQSSSPSGGAGPGAGGGGGVYSEVIDSIQRRLLNDSSLLPPSSPIHNNNNNSSVLSLLQRSGGGGRSSSAMSASRGGGGGGTGSSFSLPTNITVYHLTTNPNKISKSSIYKKMRLGLQFSLGPDGDETALSLSPVTGGSYFNGAGRGGANGGDNSGSYFSHQSRQDSGGLSSFSSGSASAATVLIYLEDILHVDMACEELPVDDSDCVVFHITVIRTARSTGMIDASVAAGVAGALSSAPPTHDQPVSTLTNRRSSNNAGGALSMPSQLRGTSGGGTEMETIGRKGGGRGGGNDGSGGITSERDPVRVTLFAPISPSVEEWVQFLNENLGDRVSLGSSLL